MDVSSLDEKSALKFVQGYGSWANWSQCSKSCGNGKMTSSRTCSDGPCSLSVNRETSCNLRGCEYFLNITTVKLFKGLSQWTSWGSCDIDDCLRRRIRTCSEGSCPESLIDIKFCEVVGNKIVSICPLK